jgi:molybdopterin-containing oxidoreductase family membrane subunit
LKFSDLIAKQRDVGRRFYALVGVLLAVIVVGLSAWVLQLQSGLVITNMRNVISWGVYISLFAWFVGVSAGGLIVSSSAAVFRIKEWEPISKMANLIAAVVIALAAIAILPDIGRPDRILNLFLYPNWSSPLMWDVTIIFTYLIISVSELLLLIRADAMRKRGNEVSARRNSSIVRVLAFVALPVAVLTHSITAWIFGLQISRPLWNTALLAPLFLASALASGLGLVIFVSILGNRLGATKVSKETVVGLGRLLGVIILVDLFLLASEYITAFWPGAPAETAPFVVEFFGPYGGLAWIQWSLAIASFALLVYPRLRNSLSAKFVAAAAILVEVFFYRLELVIPAFVNPLIQLQPGTSIGTYVQGVSSFAFAGVYLPSDIEWSITAALVALAVLLIAVGLTYLPVTQGQESPTMEVGAGGIPSTRVATSPAVQLEPDSDETSK